MAKAKAKTKSKAKSSKKAKTPVKKKALKAKPATKKAKAKKVPAKKVVAKKASKTKAAKTKASKTTTSSKPIQSLTSKIQTDLSKFVTPLDDRLIVEITQAAKMTAGGLYIPDTAQSVSGNLKGLVLAVGRGHRDPKGRVRPMDVRVGDAVLFAEFSGSKLNFMGRELMILRESEVMGVIS